MMKHETPFVTDGDLIVGLRVAELTVLGFTMSSFPVNVFDLGYEDIDGLLGMNFLSEFNFEVRSAERRILVERIAHQPV